METLFELYLVTGEDKYLEPLPAAFAWYEKSRLPDGKYARFYELQTNKPLYCVKDTYELTYDDSNLPTHYGFKLDGIDEDLADLREVMGKPREELLENRNGPRSEKSWAGRAKGSAGKVNTALKSQHEDGYWLKDDLIDAGEFTKHFQAMNYYLDAAKKGGEVFTKLREG
jgi:hypothetical protein